MFAHFSFSSTVTPRLLDIYTCYPFELNTIQSVWVPYYLSFVCDLEHFTPTDIEAHMPCLCPFQHQLYVSLESLTVLLTALVRNFLCYMYYITHEVWKVDILGVDTLGNWHYEGWNSGSWHLRLIRWGQGWGVNELERNNGVATHYSIEHLSFLESRQWGISDSHYDESSVQEAHLTLGIHTNRIIPHLHVPTQAAYYVLLLACTSLTSSK